MRVVKYVAIALAVLIVALVVAVSTMDFGRFKGYAVDAAKDATGRQLTIDGEVHLSLLPVPSLVAEKVHFANAPWGSAPDMVKVDRVEARVALLPLLSHDIVVERLVLISPQILLETDKSGRGNWEFAAPQPAAPAAASQPGKPAAPGEGATPSIPVLNDITIEKGLLVSKDGKTGKTTTLALDKLDLKGAGSGVPLKVDMSGFYDQNKFEVAGTLGSLADLSGKKPWPVDVTAKAGGATVTAKGTIAKPMEAKGVDLNLSAEGKDLTDLGKLAGSALPALGAYKLTAHLTGPGAEGWAIKDLSAAVGKTTLTGQVAVDPDKTPLKLVAKLETPELDLAALSAAAPKPASDGAKSGPSLGVTTAKPKSSNSARLFSDAPLPLDALKSVDADVSLAAKRIVQDKLELADANVHAVVARGKLTVQPLKAGIAGGALDATATIDAAPATPAVTLQANGKDVDLATVMAALGNPGMIEGAKGGLHANLKGQGKSVREIMASLDGSFGVVTGKGRIGTKAMDALSSDLAKLLTLSTMGGSQQSVNQLNCIAVPFNVSNGVAKTNAILIDTGRVTVRGEGTVDLRSEHLDLVLTPSAKDASIASYLSLPVRVGGTLANPSFSPDQAAVAKNVAGAVIGGAINPLSLLAPLVTGGSGDENPCATGAAAKGTPPAASQGAKPQTPQDQVRDKVQGIGKSLRGLFGK
jgi:uncharacterized protein involved in outer membrane biogenesis